MAGKKSSGNQENNARQLDICILMRTALRPNWRYILDNEHIEWIESPWHDKDINGVLQKKKHKHLALLFAGQNLMSKGKSNYR